MNFQPSDYLADLNLVFDGTEVSPVEEPSQADLEYFTQAEFFDLDVFSEDVPRKLLMKQDQPLQLQQQQALEPAAATPETGYLMVSELELKRKKNTAASARFRIKKKLKEKQMEQQAKELQERLAALKKKLLTLEMENKCLKRMISEKNEKKNCDLLESIKKRSLIDAPEDPLFSFTR